MVQEVETNRLIHLYTPLFFGWTISLSQSYLGTVCDSAGFPVIAVLPTGKKTYGFALRGLAYRRNFQICDFRNKL
jgi:hypothetical protein